MCLNSEATIESLLNSVAAQSYGDIEHIIVDGGSSDKTLEIIKHFNGHPPILISGKDGGIYDAMNKGLALATGEVIGFLNSDDCYADSKIISKVADAFLIADIDGVYGDLAYVDTKNPPRVIRYWKAGLFKKNSLKLGWMTPHPTLYLRRAVYERYGSFSTKYRISGDYEFILRIFSKKINISYLPVLMVLMNSGGASNKSLRNIILKTLEDYKIVKKHGAGGWATIFFKNLSKLSQFLIK